jgi:DNA (cytosine-5)-methyltransferase 1
VTVLELFAGCGGASLGLRPAGLRAVAAVDHDPAAVATLTAAGFPALLADARTVDLTPFAPVDVLWASPPCQPGSTAGSRRADRDPRDGWPWTFAALDAVRPTWFLAENVLGWTYHVDRCRRDGAGCAGCAWEHQIVPAVSARFAFSGAWRLDAADFGVPQHRRRVFLWGGPVPIPAPTPTHGTSLVPRRTLRDTVGDRLLADDACDHRACYPCDGTHGRACAEPWRADRPAPTVTTTEVKGTRAHAPDWSFHGGPDRASDAAFLVAGVRRIDVVEGLVLQGLPDDWPLQGTREEQYRQVGNAVPPALAEAVARSVVAGDRALRSLLAAGVDLNALTNALRSAA